MLGNACAGSFQLCAYLLHRRRTKAGSSSRRGASKCKCIVADPLRTWRTCSLKPASPMSATRTTCSALRPWRAPGCASGVRHGARGAGSGDDEEAPKWAWGPAAELQRRAAICVRFGLDNGAAYGGVGQRRALLLCCCVCWREAVCLLLLLPSPSAPHTHCPTLKAVSHHQIVVKGVSERGPGRQARVQGQRRHNAVRVCRPLHIRPVYTRPTH